MVEKKEILVVDDDAQMRTALKEAIERLGYGVVTCDNAESALKRMQQSSFSMVITDMNMPRIDGLMFLKEIRKGISNIPVLVITGYGTIENAVEAMKEGAIDYLMKPFSFDVLSKAIESIMSRKKYEKEIITANPEMQRILSLAGSIAASNITVLIYGESGTGKELLARYIHRIGNGDDKKFIAVNCAAIPDNLLESELFGYEKGAFTGATERKIGKFELANGGTILLDEIGEMSIVLQAKLLRVLQEREIDRIGGKASIPVNARVIATTNRDLYKECKEGRFREDLYYRLNVFPIKIPPLRERVEDIPLLAKHFLEKFSAQFKKSIYGFSDEALEFLKAAYWKGNVRELENVIQRAVLLCDEEYVKEKHIIIDKGWQNDNGYNPLGISRIQDMEREMILRTLKEVNWNKTKAAKILGVSVRTIRNKLNEYGKNFPNGEKIVI